MYHMRICKRGYAHPTTITLLVYPPPPLNLESTFDFFLQEIFDFLHPFKTFFLNHLNFIADSIFQSVFPGGSIFKSEFTASVLVDTAVPSEQIDCVGRDIGQLIGSSDVDHTFLEFGRAHRNSEIGIGRRGKRKEVGKKTANMGRCHGSSGDGVCGVFGSDPGGKDVETRSKDVNTFTVVGEVCAGIGERRCTNSDGLFGCGRGVVASVLVIVSCCDGKMETSINGCVDCHIESLGASATERHVCSRTLNMLETTTVIKNTL